MKDYDTKYINKNTAHESTHEKVCVYCLNKMNHESEWSDMHYMVNYYNCDCHGAKLERDIQIKNETLAVIIKSNKEKLDNIEYNNELIQLNDKWNK